MDVQQFLLFPVCRRNRFEEISPAMGKAAYPDHILHTVVSGIAIPFQQPGKAFQEILCVVSGPSGLVILKDDGWETIIASEIDPHI